MKQYLSILSDRRAFAIFASSTLARLATQSLTIPLIFAATQRGYEFAQTGSLVGSYAIGRCIGAPFVGRIADRYGMGFTVATTGLLHFVCIMAVAGSLCWNTSALFAASFCLTAGIAFPPTSAATRAVISSYYNDNSERAAAFAIDSISLQAALIAGPLIAGAVAAVIGGNIALVGSATALMLSSFAFLLSINKRSQFNAATSTGSLLKLPSFVAVLCITFFLSLSLGCFDIGIPASLAANGDLSLTGLAFSLMAVSGMIGTLFCSASSFVRHTGKRFVFLLGSLALSVSVFGFCSRSFEIIAVWTLAGLSLGPAYANLYQITGEMTPGDRKTEAFSWLVTAGMMGNGLGAWLTGWASGQYASNIVLLYSGGGCVLAWLIGSLFLLRPNRPLRLRGTSLRGARSS